ncbi:hypothetical protein Ddye_000945 [Dipteronia dyeriana]|uniref:Uncharacterized protein n=1 Tax=Dipteronia dyeriana TaxID=168575 RepID=A0AAD9XMJ0_9ROSI|nr:hypothetical protein Ddye_000945 [Dipteronia dyeriana]
MIDLTCTMETSPIKSLSLVVLVYLFSLWLLMIWISLYIIYSVHFLIAWEVAGEDNNTLAKTVCTAILKSKENEDSRIYSSKFWSQECSPGVNNRSCLLSCSEQVCFSRNQIVYIYTEYLSPIKLRF